MPAVDPATVVAAEAAVVAADPAVVAAVVPADPAVVVAPASVLAVVAAAPAVVLDDLLLLPQATNNPDAESANVVPAANIPPRRRTVRRDQGTAISSLLFCTNVTCRPGPLRDIGGKRRESDAGIDRDHVDDAPAACLRFSTHWPTAIGGASGSTNEVTTRSSLGR